MSKFKLTFYPVIETLEEWSEFLGRYLWYLSKYDKIEVTVFSAVEPGNINHTSFPSYFMDFKEPGPDMKNLTIEKCDNGKDMCELRMVESLMDSDFVIIHKDQPLPFPRNNLFKPGNGSASPKFKESMSHEVQLLLDKRCRNKYEPIKKVVWIIDKNREDRLEGIFAASLPYFIESHVNPRAIEDMREQAWKKLIKLSENFADIKKAYIFGTAPTLNRAFEFDYTDGIRIICNSMVKDKKLMEHIKPNIMLAADAVYHFGVSKYCQRFRRDLYDVLSRYQAMLLMPERYYLVLVLNYPEFEAFTIPVPVEKKDYNIDLDEKFYVAALDNILNLLYLPAASFLADEIYAIGFYGRGKKDNYFWTYNVDTQYNDLMESVRLTHPSFFNNINYNRYSSSVADLAEMAVIAGEKRGKKYFSLTESLFPVFKERQVQKVQTLQTTDRAINGPISVFVDGNIFTLQKIGGISKYWTYLLEYYIKQPEIQKIVLRLYRGYENNVCLNNFLKDHKENSKLKFSISRYPPYDNMSYRFPLHILYRNYELLKDSYKNSIFKFDVYHSTYYSLPEKICRTKKIFITVYDMIHEQYLSKIKGRRSAKEVMKLKKRALNKCDHIICISETTKKRLLSVYPDLNSKPLSCVYLGVDEAFKNYSQKIDRVKDKYGLDFEYFLYVGNRTLYKNFDVLLESYREFSDVYPEVRLILVGGEKNFNSQQEAYFKKNKKLKENVHLFCDLADWELTVFYNLSISFISTSLEEGFGIPILEAMAAGTNIILSDIDVHNEIAKGCALYFDPSSSKSLLEKMFEVYNNRKENKHKYENHLSEFTWEKCSSKTLKTYFS